MGEFADTAEGQLAWQRTRLTPVEARDWIAAGFTTQNLVWEWCARPGFEGDPQSARRYANAGFDPDDASVWREAGFEDPTDTWDWMDVDGPEPDGSLHPEAAYQWHKIGATPEDYTAWDAAGGYESTQAAPWLSTGIPVDRAARYVDAGVTPDEARDLERRRAEGEDIEPQLELIRGQAAIQSAG